jgi:hypothetical protein
LAFNVLARALQHGFTLGLTDGADDSQHDWRAWAKVAAPGRGVVIARLVLADGQ